MNVPVPAEALAGVPILPHCPAHCFPLLVTDRDALPAYRPGEWLAVDPTPRPPAHGTHVVARWGKDEAIGELVRSVVLPGTWAIRSIAGPPRTLAEAAARWVDAPLNERNVADNVRGVIVGIIQPEGI